MMPCCGYPLTNGVWCGDRALVTFRELDAAGAPVAKRHACLEHMCPVAKAMRDAAGDAVVDYWAAMPEPEEREAT